MKTYGKAYYFSLNLKETSNSKEKKGYTWHYGSKGLSSYLAAVDSFSPTSHFYSIGYFKAGMLRLVKSAPERCKGTVKIDLSICHKCPLHFTLNVKPVHHSSSDMAKLWISSHLDTYKKGYAEEKLRGQIICINYEKKLFPPTFSHLRLKMGKILRAFYIRNMITIVLCTGHYI